MFEVEESFRGETTVVVRIRQWGVGAVGGFTGESRFWQVWSLRAGRVIRATNHAGRAEALRYAGLSL